MKIHIYDNRLKKETYCFDVMCPPPVDFLFVKDRETKKRYLMERTHGEDPFEGHHFLHPCEYSQYDDVELQIEK